MRHLVKFLSIALALNFWFHGNGLASEPKLISWRYHPFQTDCSDKSRREGFRNALVSDVRSLSEIIEKVPPDETKYLYSKIKAAFETGYRARFGLIEQRQYYRAYVVHKAAKSVIDALNYLPRHTLKLQAENAINATVKFAYFKNSYDEYLDFDSRKRKRVVSEETAIKLYFEMPMLLMNFANFSKCLVKAIN